MPVHIINRMSRIVYPKSRFVLPAVNETDIKNNTTRAKPDNKQKKYTLVLDLDETLIYSRSNDKEGNQLVYFRPGLFMFLEKLQIYYDIYIFTAGNEKYADEMADLINKHRVNGGTYFKGVYNRNHLKKNLDGTYTKCLKKFHNIIYNFENKRNERYERLFKIMNKVHYTVLVDNLYENMKYQPNNGINIKDYIGDNDDKCLYLLSDYLVNLVKSNKPIQLYNNGNIYNIYSILKNI